MKKWVCTVCGYVYEGENPPEKCPQCGVPASKFKEQAADEISWACEHEVGVAQGSPEDIMADLRANFEGECSEVGMYLAMASFFFARDITCFIIFLSLSFRLSHSCSQSTLRLSLEVNLLPILVIFLKPYIHKIIITIKIKIFFNLFFFIKLTLFHKLILYYDLLFDL